MVFNGAVSSLGRLAFLSFKSTAMSKDLSDSTDPIVHPWEKVSERLHTTCRVFDVLSRRFRHPERGSEDDFYVLRSRDWVNVLPLTPDHQVVMVRQFRFGVQQMSWEIPGGVMDQGEDPLEAGLRELREETGYLPAKARLLGSIRPNPAIQENTCHFVLAEDVTLGAELEWDPHEELETRLFPIDEVYAMAHRGEIIHSLVINALFFFYPQLQRLRARRRD